MDGRLIRTNCDEAGDYVVPNVSSPRDLVSKPDNMDETVLSSLQKCLLSSPPCFIRLLSKSLDLIG